MARLAAGLRALLAGVIDYAGLFPPARVPLHRAVVNYERYREGEYSWMLGRFVAPAGYVDFLPGGFDASLAVVGESDHPRAAAIEAKGVLHTSKPTYCEVPLQELDEVAKAGSFAKIRMGGVGPDAIPTVEAVAEFILACAERGIAFKATAGLHHPIRSQDGMHGFMNVCLAAAFARHGEKEIAPILAETDPSAFRFGSSFRRDKGARWREWSLSVDEIFAARKDFIHSFGSCSFEEPIEDLRALGWL